MRATLFGLAAAFAALLGTTASAEAVKLARTGACYGPSDPYFSGITPAASFPTMADCIGAGGWDRSMASDRTPAATMPHGVPMAANSDAVMANRTGFEKAASHWITTTGGCRDAREDMLARAARGGVAWSSDGCRIEAGVWTDALTGATHTDPERVALAHTVPLAWAEARGANTWSPAQRAAFFADRDNLLTVSPSSLPALHASVPLQGPWATSGMACTRASAFSAVVQRHGLMLSEADASSLRAALEDGCAAPSLDTIAAERAARAATLQDERAAFDAIHGVTPEERAAGPNPKPSSYPEGQMIPHVPLPVAPGLRHVVQSAPTTSGQATATLGQTTTSTSANTTPGLATSLRPVPRPGSTATPTAPAAQTVADRPPIALPGAYRGAAPVRQQEQGATPSRTARPDGDGPMGPPALPFGMDPNDPGGTITSTEELLDTMAEEMEAQGIMPPGGYLPGTAPDFNEILIQQGIDPTQFPGFDGDPNMLGLGAGGTSITVSP